MRKGNPIVGDWDLFAVEYPIDAPLFATQVYNTLETGTNQKEVLKMVSELLFLVFKRRAIERLNLEVQNLKLKKDLPQDDRFPEVSEDLKMLELRLRNAFINGEFKGDMKHWQNVKKEVEQELALENKRLNEVLNIHWKELLEYLKLQKEFWTIKAELDKMDKLEKQQQAEQPEEKIDEEIQVGKTRAEHKEGTEQLEKRRKLLHALKEHRSEIEKREKSSELRNAFKAFNRLNPVDRFFILMQNFSGILHQESLDRAGRITPFVFLYLSMLNAAYADPETVYGAQVEFGSKNPFFDVYIKYLLQHGPEEFSPYAPSAIGEIFGVYKGMIFLTHSEDQLIDVLLMANFLKSRLFHVSPGWNMEKWSKVLEAQQKLGQINLKDSKANRPEMIATVECYKDYRAVKLMEKEREASDRATFSFFFGFNLDDKKVEVLIRQLKNFQRIPEGLTGLLVNYLSNEDNLKRNIAALQNFPESLKIIIYLLINGGE